MTVQTMLDWIIANKEWVFSGVGVASISIIGALLLKKNSDKKSTQMRTISGNNIKAEGNINITTNQLNKIKTEEDLIKIASFDEIKQYDPKINTFLRVVKKLQGIIQFAYENINTCLTQLIVLFIFLFFLKTCS